MSRIYDVKWSSEDKEENYGVILVASDEAKAKELAEAELDDIDDMDDSFECIIRDVTNEKILGTYHNFIP